MDERSEPEISYDDQSASSASDDHQAARAVKNPRKNLAVNFHTIDTRSSDEHPSSRRRSATTFKAKQR